MLSFWSSFIHSFHYYLSTKGVYGFYMLNVYTSVFQFCSFFSLFQYQWLPSCLILIKRVRIFLCNECIISVGHSDFFLLFPRISLLNENYFGNSIIYFWYDFSLYSAKDFQSFGFFYLFSLFLQITNVSSL